MNSNVSHIKLTEASTPQFGAAVRKHMPNHLIEITNEQTVTLGWVEQELARIANLVDLRTIKGPVEFNTNMFSPVKRMFGNAEETIGSLEFYKDFPAKSILMVLNVTNESFPPSWLNINGRLAPTYAGDVFFIDTSVPHSVEPIKAHNMLHLLLVKIFFKDNNELS